MRRLSVLPLAALAALAFGGSADAGGPAKYRATCAPTTNPHGKNSPARDAGFYRLGTTSGKGKVWLVDAGAWKAFGPFPVGTRVKYTQAPGATPSVRKIGSKNGEADAVALHIIGKGDPYAASTDGHFAACR